jgi:hypothetical protein
MEPGTRGRESIGQPSRRPAPNRSRAGRDWPAMSRLRFLADHDLNEHIVTGVKRLNPRIEFIRVRDVGLEAASDHEVLA